jgi:excisionase family DNA binding protein
METSMAKIGFLSTAQGAREAGVTRTTIYDWVRRGWLPLWKIGRHSLIRSSDIQKALLIADQHRKKIGRGGLRLSEIEKLKSLSGQ